MISRFAVPALAGAIAFAAACSFASRSDQPTPQQRPQATNVTRLYNDTCAKCHGQEAQGGGAGTQTLLTLAKFDQTFDRPFFETIKNGAPDSGMEAYGGTLSDEEIWALVVHIRELQAKALRAKTGSTKPVDGIVKTALHSYRIEEVVGTGRGLATPWGVDWLPDGRMLVTNRPGTAFVLDQGEMVPIEGLPKVLELGQGGLMAVTVHPRYEENGWVYLGFADPVKSGGRAALTKIVRGKLAFEGSKARWTGEETVFEAAQEFYSGAGVHFGTRIAFDGKGHVFFVVGERGTNMRAQDPATPYGKIMRLHEDGTVPSDNPFPGSPVWTLGHRNPQGLVFDLEGNLWDTEHGPRGGDELNRIVKGANYGWPVVAFSINYNDSPFRTPWPGPDQKFTQPEFRWLPSCAACGLDVAAGPAFPKWKGDLLAGGLAGENVDRIRIKSGRFVEREELLHGMGRVRDVAVAPDGSVVVVLNGPDKIIRLVQAD